MPFGLETLQPILGLLGQEGEAKQGQSREIPNRMGPSGRVLAPTSSRGNCHISVIQGH